MQNTGGEIMLATNFGCRITSKRLFLYDGSIIYLRHISSISVLIPNWSISNRIESSIMKFFGYGFLILFIPALFDSLNLSLFTLILGAGFVLYSRNKSKKRFIKIVEIHKTDGTKQTIELFSKDATTTNHFVTTLQDAVATL